MSKHRKKFLSNHKPLESPVMSAYAALAEPSDSVASKVEHVPQPATLFLALAKWHANSRMGLYWPLPLAFVLMLPRLMHPHFGLLDDGVTLGGARLVTDVGPKVAFQLGGDTGRFSPLMWLLWSVIYRIGGNSPLTFFFANCLLLIGITAGLMWIVYSLSGNRFQAQATGLFFLSAGPIVENFYTVTKGEPLQALWMTLSVGLIVGLHRTSDKKRQAAVGLAVTALLLFAILTKETAVVLIAISAGCLLTAWGWQMLTHKTAELHWRLIYFAAGVLAVIAFFCLRSQFVSVALSAGSYTQYYRLEWRTLESSVLRWLAWLIRDFPYLFPILVFVIASRIGKTLSQGWILLDSGIWMLGWLAIYLPWHGASEYYLLPFSLGCTIFCGAGLSQMLKALRSPARQPLRRLAKVCLVVCVICVAMTVANYVTSLRIQIAVDDANADAIDFIADLPGSARVFINIPSATEYFFEMGLHLTALRDRSDILLQSFKGPPVSPDGKQISYYILTPIFYNQLFPSIRIGIDENSAHHWNNLLERAFGGRPDVFYISERQVQMVDFGLHRFVCYLTNGKSGINCNYSRPFLDARIFRYGWRVYHIKN
jgi:hypothetical protein